MRDPHTGRSPGFGFITFSNQHEADAAVAGMNGKELDGRLIRVNHVLNDLREWHPEHQKRR